MRYPLGLVLGLVLGLTPVAGCGPEIPPEELGIVLEEVPEIPGPEEPFELPGSAPAVTPGVEAPGIPP